MAGGGSIFTEDHLAVANVNPLLRAADKMPGLEVEWNHPVVNRQGEQLAVVLPVDDDTTGKKLARWAFALVLSSSAKKDVYDLRVADGSDATLLNLHQAGSILHVRDTAGVDLGGVEARRMHRGLEIAFHAPNPERQRRRSLGRTFPDPPLATITTGYGRLDCDVIDVAGAPVAHITTDDGSNTLELRFPTSDQLRTLLVAFTCALVDKYWIRPPQIPKG